eukprot:358549-Pleurochrysis_carterae.AAC.1
MSGDQRSNLLVLSSHPIALGLIFRALLLAVYVPAPYSLRRLSDAKALINDERRREAAGVLQRHEHEVGSRSSDTRV